MKMLMDNEEFVRHIQSHWFFTGQTAPERFLQDPMYLSALGVFLKEKNLTCTDRNRRFLEHLKNERMSLRWMEKILQGFLYDDTASYFDDEEYRENMIRELKTRGIIEKRKVSMRMSPDIEKMLTNSTGKCESIKKIVEHEYRSMGSGLRMLILADYIRKEYEKTLGDRSRDASGLGVMPFFEQLRRDCEDKNIPIRFGVLCGTVVIIPAEAGKVLLTLTEKPDQVVFHRAGHLGDYVTAEITGDSHGMIRAVTELFARGHIQVLIGTKSLLGEGWDSPCINSLILASFVGSYMLSNQMRGRAIRVWKEDPEKTSNIWHLICVKPGNEDADTYDNGESEDYETLTRRMEHFMGLHYDKDTIESGMERITAIRMPFTPENVEMTNREMLEKSSHRELLKEQWRRSLAIYEKMDVVDETEIPERMIPDTVYKDARRSTIWKAAAAVLCGAAGGILGMQSLSGAGFFQMAGLAAAAVLAVLGIKSGRKLYHVLRPAGRLKELGKGIQKALNQAGLMEMADTVAETEEQKESCLLYLLGGTGHDKALFAKCVHEFFGGISIQRYILHDKSKVGRPDEYLPVPECFGRRKEDAQIFADCMRPYVGKYETVYTYSESGKEALVDARMKTLDAQQGCSISRKTVKNIFG